MSDLISRQAAIDAIEEWGLIDGLSEGQAIEILSDHEKVPSAQPEPISEAYSKAVLTWLLDYQIKAAGLNGIYSPYEVLSWVVNDWRKENEARCGK